ncbi:hypothetical protein MLD38_030045 [Melastoma candidum]|uniref:Uncharacterized protein n=1 Tax=Melastoma candidum TaxID=119954 RepID=A0ACB9MK53_9MYRT|nr:hypothetical protein MLD38_030045 [Melastoma candidum]
MKDSTVKRMKDLLFVARAYFPSIAKLSSRKKFSQELKQNIQDFERILSDASKDSDLPPQIGARWKECKLQLTRRNRLEWTAIIIAVQTMPKGLHCLSMRLAVDYFTSSTNDIESPLAEKYLDPSLHHIVVFSKNVLASSVVVNSTVMNAKESGKLGFHVSTDKENYFSMKLWFFRNKYKAAVVQRYKSSCAWMSGLNLIDLERWRELKLSQTYQRFLRRALPGEAVSLYSTLLTFQNLIHPQDSSWPLSGLGHNYGLNAQVTRKAAVLHYNGAMKPWLDLGIPKYKDYWRKYLDRDDQILSDCNINP